MLIYFVVIEKNSNIAPAFNTVSVETGPIAQLVRAPDS